MEALYRIRDAVRRRSLVRKALAAAPGERVLGVGCGPGFYCAERVLAPAMRAAGFQQVEMSAHSFASAEFDSETYGAALVPVISGFVAGRRNITVGEASAWAAEQHELGERCEYYFSCTQFCFTATRPN